MSSSTETIPGDLLYQKCVQKFYREFDNGIYAAFIVLSIMSVIIILVNSFVLFLFFLERNSIKTAHKYIISMAANDLLTGFVVILMEFYFFDVHTLLNPVACIVISTIVYFIIINSLLTILVTSADRYWSIAFPVHYRMHVKDKVPNYILITAWCISIIYALISLAFTTDVNPEVGICRYNPVYVTVAATVIPVVCLLSLVSLYVLVYRTLKQKVFRPNVSIFGSRNIFHQIIRYSEQLEEENDEKEECNQEKKLDKEVKTTITLFLTVTAAIVITIPSFIILAITKIWPGTLSNSIFYSCLCCSLLHPIINPLLYVYCISNVRKRGKKVLRKLLVCKKETVEVKRDEASQKTQSSIV